MYTHAYSRWLQLAGKCTQPLEQPICALEPYFRSLPARCSAGTYYSTTGAGEEGEEQTSEVHAIDGGTDCARRHFKDTYDDVKAQIVKARAEPRNAHQLN